MQQVPGWYKQKQQMGRNLFGSAYWNYLTSDIPEVEEAIDLIWDVLNFDMSPEFEKWDQKRCATTIEFRPTNLRSHCEQLLAFYANDDDPIARLIRHKYNGNPSGLVYSYDEAVYLIIPQFADSCRHCYYGYVPFDITLRHAAQMLIQRWYRALDGPLDWTQGYPYIFAFAAKAGEDAVAGVVPLCDCGSTATTIEFTKAPIVLPYFYCGAC